MPLVAFFQKKPWNSLKQWNFLLHLGFEGKLSKILYDMSMKMMIRDNFVHGDLHGGNILYSMSDDHVTVLDAGIATSLDKRTFAPFGNSAETRHFFRFSCLELSLNHIGPWQTRSSRRFLARSLFGSNWYGGRVSAAIQRSRIGFMSAVWRVIQSARQSGWHLEWLQGRKRISSKHSIPFHFSLFSVPSKFCPGGQYKTVEIGHPSHHG